MKQPLALDDRLQTNSIQVLKSSSKNGKMAV